MALLFGRGLSLLVCSGVMASAFAADVATSSADKLDDEGEVALQQALNDVYNTYNPQIATLNGEIDTLSSTGNKQCEMEAKATETEAEQQQSQAQMQALQSMIPAGAKTLGHVVDATMNGAKSEKGAKEQELTNTVNNCNSDGTYGTMNVKVFTCTKTGVMATKQNCNTYQLQTPPDTNQYMMCTNQASNAMNWERRIAELNKEIKDTGGAMDGLISSGMELAAAGIGGMMVANQGKEMAGYLADSAASQEELCKAQVAAQLTALQNQIAQLQAAKARDLLMANMTAEYQTKVRRKNEVENIDDDETSATNGDTIAVEGSPEIAEIPPISTATFKPTGGGSAGGGSSGGGGTGGSAGTPEWDFGGGEGFDGGSSLPEQPAVATYSGTGASASNAGKGTGGFGSLDGKGDGKGERGLASEEGEVIGDGGLRVLLARASLIHTRHASILLKSIDFDRLAKSQGLTPKPASVSPAGPN